MAGNPTGSDLVREASRTKLVGGVANRVNIGRKLGLQIAKFNKYCVPSCKKIRSDLLTGKLKIHN